VRQNDHWRIRLFQTRTFKLGRGIASVKHDEDVARGVMSSKRGRGIEKEHGCFFGQYKYMKAFGLDHLVIHDQLSIKSSR
jgi:hypothetical protein